MAITPTSMMTRNKLLTCLALLSALPACAEDEPPLIEVHALPQELSDIDVTYIPFEYDEIGSYNYHMPLLAMELAARGIPSLSAKVSDCDGEWSLKAPNGEEWGYHYALAVNHDGKTMIVDPVLSSDFLTIDEFNAAFDANSAVVIGSEEAIAGPDCTNTVLEPVPAKVEDMPHFDFANVMTYCAYMKRFYRDIGGDYSAREEKLVSRVRELTLAMHELGLLEVWEDDPEFQLVKKEPYCPRPTPLK